MSKEIVAVFSAPRGENALNLTEIIPTVAGHNVVDVCYLALGWDDTAEALTLNKADKHL
jgi:hypothetical protein